MLNTGSASTRQGASAFGFAFWPSGHTFQERIIHAQYSLASRLSSPLRRQGPSASVFGYSLLEHAPSERGIPAFFHSPQASEPPFFAWPKKHGPKKGHPTLAPYAQSLCSRFASLLRGSPTVHPWTDVELAHIVWAILRTIPSQSRRDRGDPNSAHRARQSQSQRQRQRRNLLRLGCAGCAVNGPPERRRSDVGKPAGWAQWIAPSLASVQGWTVDKPRSRFADSEGTKPVERRFGVAFSLVTLLLATQEKVTRSLEASEIRQGCRATQERALRDKTQNHRHWVPAFAGATSESRRV